MFRLLLQADLCPPVSRYGSCKWRKPAGSEHHVIETELRQLALDHVQLSKFMYAALLRNGFYPSPAIRTYMDELGAITWVTRYLDDVTSLQDLAVRVLRSYLHLSGNIMYGVRCLRLPSRTQQLILQCNPL